MVFFAEGSPAISCALTRPAAPSPSLALPRRDLHPAPTELSPPRHWRGRAGVLVDHLSRGTETDLLASRPSCRRRHSLFTGGRDACRGGYQPDSLLRSISRSEADRDSWTMRLRHRSHSDTPVRRLRSGPGSSTSASARDEADPDRSRTFLREALIGRPARRSLVQAAGAMTPWPDERSARAAQPLDSRSQYPAWGLGRAAREVDSVPVEGVACWSAHSRLRHHPARRRADARRGGRSTRWSPLRGNGAAALDVIGPLPPPRPASGSRARIRPRWRPEDAPAIAALPDPPCRRDGGRRAWIPRGSAAAVLIATSPSTSAQAAQTARPVLERSGLCVTARRMSVPTTASSSAPRTAALESIPLEATSGGPGGPSVINVPDPSLPGEGVRRRRKQVASGRQARDRQHPCHNDLGLPRHTWPPSSQAPAGESRHGSASVPAWNRWKR